MSDDNAPALALRDARVWVAGHRGMVGSAVVRRLAREQCEVLTAGRDSLNLIDQQATEKWIAAERPDIIVLAAAKVGGILANSQFPAEFLYENLAIASNVIHAAYRSNVRKLLFLGSSCIYPKFAPQPISESSLLTGPLEPTNEAYALAKIAGIKLCSAYRAQYGASFISAQPTNLYGPNDNFDPRWSHVLPAMIGKIHRAKMNGEDSVPIWGTGTPRREFLHVDDLADAIVYLLQHYDGESPVNVGVGKDISIAELAAVIADTAGWKGTFSFDATKPDGTPQKLLDVSLLTGLGWRPSIALREGIRNTYDWFQEHHA